ncbi:MAG TPA: class I SAM-dependent methyltransferase [Blastocatellia bacterium]|nr:class I SAM-dependent methyltransferase [Blastocatellia bacterium]
MTKFDAYAADYDAALHQGLAATGEDKDYFASGRIAWLGHCLKRLRDAPRSAMDFGCGTGSATPFLFEHIGVESVLGLDVSPASVETAQKTHTSDAATFLLFDQYDPAAQIDLAFSNGVFHHIVPNERPQAVDYLYRSLRAGGLLAVWENNPWNPGTRYVMSRIPFDRDAITLTAGEARALLRAGGFEILRTDFLFIFPRALGMLRGLERFVTRLPLGGQYQILCRKPRA